MAFWKKKTLAGGGSRRVVPWLAAAAVTVAAVVATVPLAFGAVTGVTSVDPDTSNNWSSIAASSNSTENVGRIWTDKSVYNADHSLDGALSGKSISKGDSDFLVGLSAMSSTSNVKSTVTRTDPLDIVLIIDRSSSMHQDIEQAGSYTEINASDVEEADGYLEWHDGIWGFGEGNEAHQTSGVNEYYALVDGEYVRINEETETHNGDGWYEGTSYEEHIRWTLNGQTVTPEDTQFYEYQQGGTISRMEALKTAANNFIDSAAGLPNSEQVRIGIVSFAGSSDRDWNSASIDRELTDLSGNNAESLKATVNSINPPSSGAGTYPANAFEDAQSMFNGSAQGTQKVVVFFTDGGPGGTTGSVLDNGVANDTIQASHAVKVSGATVYSVGVLDGADPSADISNVSNNSNSTLRVNAYMHAVSSNYPSATGFTSNAIGYRAPNSDYYKAASNSEELNDIFSNIFDEIEQNQGSGSPIEENVPGGGAENTPGNLVFEDQLGDYMQVTGDKMTLVYADGLHESTRTTTQGNVTTYYFEGQFVGNGVYGAANYSDITVTVTHSSDPATGDKVTATIPASLIPMRSYNIDMDSETPTMTITDAYPMRLYYGVSLKREAKDALNSGTGDVYEAIVESQASESGTVDFYTNAFIEAASTGLTTATFTPNEANKFYYYTQDTTLYLDEDCTQVATSQNSQRVDTFYYSEPYWTRNQDGTAVEHNEGIAISRLDTDFGSVETNWRGELYIPAHTARQDRPNTLNVTKNPNETGTASEVLAPAWNNTNESVTQHLGNNGKMSYPMPGSLEIKKTVDWTNASSQTQQDKNSFTFDISLTDADNNPISGTYNYYVDNAETASGQVIFTNGHASIKVNGGTTVRIDGLTSGAKFTVTEQGVGENGFTVTSDSTSQAEGENVSTTDGIVSGTIVAGSQVSLSFDNRYHAEDIDLNATATLQVKKNLTNREWRDTDEFTFVIDGLGNTAAGNIATPEPAETTITIDDETTDYTKVFGDITFTAPGVYRYSVVEDNDTNPIAGIDYSDAIYRVVVTVIDDGAGQLEISGVKVEQTQNDEGSMGAQDEPIAVEGTTMTFTNNYDAGVGTTNINAVKNYVDTTGGNPIDHNKFQFQIEALGGYETDGGSSSSYTVDAADVPMPEGSTGTTKQMGNTGSQVNFGTITYDGDAVGKTFEYKVTELGGNEQGMDYDKTEHIVQVKVEEVTDDTGTHIVATVLGDYADPSNLSFSNTYKPTEVTLSGDTAIHGTKTLTGRDLNDGEKFYFTLTQTGGPATLDPNDDADAYDQVLAQPEIVSVDSLTDGSADFSFGDLSFTQVGTYTFTVDETAENGSDTTDGNGLTYSKNVTTVTVEVKDNGEGALVPTVSYVNSTGSTATDKAVFTNVYESSMDYGADGAGGITVTKQLNGRPMAADEFTFTITGQDAAADMTTDLDQEFKNTGAAEGKTISMEKLQSLSFDQDDAGKTYTFIVDEVEGDLTKVTYDQSQYEVEIAVYDDGLGHMHTVTNVTKIKDAQGDTVNEPVVTDADSSADEYSVPTFGFVNTYTPDQVVVGEDAKNAIQVTKTVTGAPSPDGVSYGFTLTLTSNNADGIASGMDVNDEGALQAHIQTSGVIEANGSQAVSFGDISFSKPGTYTFNVTEDALAADDGWSYDTVNSGPKTVTVVVRNTNDQGQFDGKLYIDSVTGNPAEVTNSYKPGEVVVGGDGAEQQITVQKTVTGADSNATFTFQIEPVIDNDHTSEWWSDRVSGTAGFTPETTISSVTQGQAKTATFGGITFNAEGEYQFKITERGAADFNAGDTRNGWTYDEHASYATVTVTDTDYDGYLEASVSYNNDDATTEADQAVDNAAAFTNAYTTTPAELTKDAESGIGVQKHVEGAPNSTNFAFTATFNADASAEQAADASLTAGVASSIEGLTDGKLSVTISDDFKADDTKAADFGTIKLTKPGVYVFDVTEENAKSEAPNGWTYDTATHQITVTVTDNGQGKLEASVENNDPLFTNSYQAGSITLDGDDQLKVTKEVTGAPALSDFDFTLKLTDGDPSGVTGIGDDGITKSTSGLTGKEGDEAKQTVSFGSLTFTKAGTYEFQVVENTTTAADGWTYASGEDNAKTITVTVTDDQFGGQLEATTEVDGTDTNNPTFTNSYKASSITTGEDGLAKLQVTKAVTGAPATEEFTFELTPAKDYGDKVEGLKDGKLTASTTDLKGQEDSRTLTFGDLTFNAEGTYTFDVKEANADPAEGSGWTYDNDAAKQITVVVTDENHDGKLDATTVVDGQDTNNPTFTNAYVPAEITTGADAGTAIQVTKKVTGRDATEAFDFSLTLKEGQNADAVFKGKGEDKTPFDGMELTTSKDIKAGKTETKTFGDITFTEAGDYAFVIDETTTTTAGGWTYDDSTHEVTVHVKDNGEGELYIDGIDGNDPTFENVYKLQPAKFRAARFMLQGNKVLDGRTWETGDEFTFTLTPGRGDNVDGSQMSEDEVMATMPASTSDTIRPADGDGSKVTDNSAQFTFTDERFPGEDIVGNEDDVFTYTKPGTYRYLIRETNPNVSIAGSGILGVSYDQTVYRLTVKVTDNGDGTMSAEGSYTKRNADGTWTDLTGSNEVTFTNKYSSDEVEITFNAFKVLQNRDQNMKDGEFTFHMEFAGWAANDANADPNDDSAWTMDDTTNAPEAAADTGNIIRGDVTFDGMAFTKDNVGYTYRYKITENTGAVPGVTYDTTAHYVTAKVTSVQQEDPNSPGTYIEHVRVETSGEAEWNEQTGTAPTTGAIFTNTYKAGATTGVPAGFSFTKQFTGHKWTNDYSFEFTLTAQDSQLADGTPVAAADVPMPASATKTVSAPDQEGGDTAAFDFGSISYDKAGTYNYTVTETNAGQGGITYDAHPAQVTVTVTEDKDSTGALTGQLVATAIVTNADFVNTYETSASYNAGGVGGLDITKQLNNHTMADDQFSFTITATGDNADAAAKKLGIQDGLTTTVKSAAAAANTAQSVKSNPFDTIVFNEKDDGVTYTYTITENTDGVDSHYKTDDAIYTVAITPTDNGDGTMKVTTDVNGNKTVDQRATVAFVNSYQADPTTVGAKGAATIEGSKTLKNDTLTNGQFTFQVKSGDVVVAEGTNDANGKITFGDITYNTENLAAAATVDGSDKVGKATVQTTDAGTEYTFTYTVSEVAPATGSGVTASTAAQNVTITVTDDGNGTLTPVVTYGDGDPLAFENVYGGDAEFALDIAGTKKIVGAQDNLNVPQLTADAYQFTITGNPAADGTPAPMPAVTTVGNDASGNVTFGDIVYTMENTFGSAPATAEAAADDATDEGIETYTAGRTQVFTYTISESGTVAGVTNEQGTKTVQVTVTDLGGGKIKAEVTSDKTAEGADFGFTNVYDVKPEDSSLTGNGGFTITKDFLSTNTDRTLVEGEYEFQLKSGDDVVATASNDAAGNVSFGSITFTKPGTYNYTLSEVNGGKPGVTYDQTVYNVTAKVEDNGDGTLTVTWEMPQAVNNGVAFSNTYTAADANITLKAAKVLNGRALADGEFTFELRENGTVLDTATNDATGQVTFDVITYSEPGEHDYEIVEVAGNEANMTYDTTVHTVHVSVTDNTETGSLAVAWNYGETGEPVFTNTYTEPVTPSEPSGPSEPAKPADNLPVTGDYTLPIVGGIVVAGAALILGGRAIRKRGE